MRGYREEGTTTTPFDMVVLNGMSRYHLVIEALRRTPNPPEHADLLADECRELLQKHTGYVRAHFEDMPEIQAWVWR